MEEGHNFGCQKFDEGGGLRGGVATRSVLVAIQGHTHTYKFLDHLLAPFPSSSYDRRT